jgi:hypothetical protein
MALPSITIKGKSYAWQCMQQNMFLQYEECKPIRLLSMP